MFVTKRVWEFCFLKEREKKRTFSFLLWEVQRECRKSWKRGRVVTMCCTKYNFFSIDKVLSRLLFHNCNCL